MDIILSTRNPSKAVQIQGCFEGSSIKILTLDDVGISGEAIEDGKTLEENALKKALFAYEKSGKKAWVMSDDTGLFIRALNDEPGVYAARWAGESATTDEITEHAIKKLSGISDRRATFKTVVVVINPDGETMFFSGEVHGNMQETPRVKPQPKMPYSPLFQPEGSDKVWAEMSTEEENAISHRGIAFRQAREFLEKLIQLAQS